ncbi:MAG TPA: hypothetical protein VJR03_01195 [Nitrospira sp.]|nr:hypothetical protein [Nitrospira sp.]
MPGDVKAAEKVSATVLVKDSLTAPRQPAMIEAKLLAKGLLHDSPLGGEPVELVVNGSTAATGMTGGDGRALLSLVTAVRGIVPIQIRVGASPRVSAAEGQANLVVWDRRTPVLVVELSSLMEEPRFEGPLPDIVSAIQQDMRPMADAANELGKLSQFYYGIIYVATVPPGGDPFPITSDARRWLSSHKFPLGLTLALPSGEDAVGAQIDQLHEAGWKTVKIGIGRSKAFVEPFLRRRLEAIMIPEPKGDVPRKAKVAKDWKEVRKKL